MTARASRRVGQGTSRHRARAISAVLNKTTKQTKSRGATIAACAPPHARPRIAISPRREDCNAEESPAAQLGSDCSQPSPLGLELIHGSAIKVHGNPRQVNNLQNSNRR